MKTKLFVAVLAAVLLVAVLTGCQVRSAGNSESTPPHTSSTTPVQTLPQNAATPTQTDPQSTTAAQGTAPKLTAAQAEAIALAHAELTAEQVTGLRSEYEIDDGIPLYEVQFRKGYVEYEYDIHAESGKILSFDIDD